MTARNRVGDLLRATRRRLGLARPRGPDWHRAAVGGRWDALGALQFEFLRARGLRPEHTFLDVGCGALRGGVRLVAYLDDGRYHGVEKEARLLAAGRDVELPRAGLAGRRVHLFATAEFDLAWVPAEVRFDVALAQSLFTHLRPDQIALCMRRVGERLAPDGVFYATYFEAPGDAVVLGPPHAWRDDELAHPAYPFAVLAELAVGAGLRAERLGAWGHPRGQLMLALRRAESA